MKINSLLTALKILLCFYSNRFGNCTCNPPKHCKVLEETVCHNDDQCGVGGHCYRPYLTELGMCRCEPPKQCKELIGTVCCGFDQCGVGGYCYRPFLSMFGQCKCKGIIT